MLRFLLTLFLTMGLQPVIALGGNSQEEFAQMARKHLSSIYHQYDPSIAIDENAINDLVEWMIEHSDVFDYLSEIQTDPEFLPYLERYNLLKIQYTGRPMNPEVRIVFSSHPLKSTNNTMAFAANCEPLTQTIFVDRSFWHTANEKLKELIT